MRFLMCIFLCLHVSCTQDKVGYACACTSEAGFDSGLGTDQMDWCNGGGINYYLEDKNEPNSYYDPGMSVAVEGAEEACCAENDDTCLCACEYGH